jgi:hypothetical protein
MPELDRLGLPAVACVALLSLAACGQSGGDEMSWARAALDRNSDVEVVAADQQKHTFTVRIKDTGELRMVRADDLIAAPAPAASAVAAAPGSSASSAQPAGGNTATPPATARAAPAEPAAGAAPAQPSTQPSSFVPQNAGNAPPGGKVLESGPGYTIQAAAAPAPAAVGRARETGITTAALERRHEPIICQGARRMHIDNRNLAFDGDAVNAEDGCEIYITNSHISAGAIGVLAHAANVHIENSLIEGEQASIDASGGAQIYAASSHFRGLSRQLDSATFHDLGGNIWN